MSMNNTQCMLTKRWNSSQALIISWITFKFESNTLTDQNNPNGKGEVQTTD
jgi:hypothetical protein